MATGQKRYIPLSRGFASMEVVSLPSTTLVFAVAKDGTAWIAEGVTKAIMGEWNRIRDLPAACGIAMNARTVDCEVLRYLTELASVGAQSYDERGEAALSAAARSTINRVRAIIDAGM